MPEPIDDLKQRIADGHVVAILGAGVSVGATHNAPAASWVGLLESGVERCCSLKKRLKGTWSEQKLKFIHSKNTHQMIAAAQSIVDELGGQSGGEFRLWLRDSFENLECKNDAVIRAIHELGVAIATTNYDGLFEGVTGWSPVTWRDSALAQRILREGDKRVLHLHGYWEEPERVILGASSYDAVLADGHAQNLQHAFGTARTLLFIGCGEGLSDPNFDQFRYWARSLFPNSEYRHYRLALNKDVDDLQAEHLPEERILVLGYGETHEDLPGFLTSLMPKSPKIPMAAPAPPPNSSRLPAKVRCFGREKELESLISTLLEENPAPTPILGPPGIGKSNLTIAALHNPRIAERYGSRRYFVRCDGAASREALAAEIGRAVGLEPGPQMETRVLAELGSTRTMLVLDNGETPWEAQPEATEEFFANLSSLGRVALVVSVRGQVRPAGPLWREAIKIEPLKDEPARQTFLKIAGEKHQADPHLDRLIKAVDYVPIAVVLLAHQAEAEPNLSALWQRWETESSGLLKLGKIERSYELSISGPRMTEEAKRLLSVMAILPAGIAHEDILFVFRENALKAATILRQTGLAFDEQNRLRMLAPLREYVRSKHEPLPEDIEQAIEFYSELARVQGPKLGYGGGAEAVQRLTGELANIEAMLHKGMDSPFPLPAVKAASHLSYLIRLTGVGNEEILLRALSLAVSQKDEFTLADLSFALGDIAHTHSKLAKATAHYEEALPFYRKVRDVRGEANCIQRLGDIACTHSEYARAATHYEKALPLYRKVKDVRGEANCIGGLGDIALNRSDYEAATTYYKEALLLYRKVSNVHGEANCISGLGKIASAHSDNEKAREYYQEALQGYARIPEPYSIGWTHVRLARIAQSEEEKIKHASAARQAWNSINRQDLIQLLDAEFPGVGE